jgi:hypothetical protein
VAGVVSALTPVREIRFARGKGAVKVPGTAMTEPSNAPIHVGRESHRQLKRWPDAGA